MVVVTLKKMYQPFHSRFLYNVRLWGGILGPLCITWWTPLLSLHGLVANVTLASKSGALLGD